MFWRTEPRSSAAPPVPAAVDAGIRGPNPAPAGSPRAAPGRGAPGGSVPFAFIRLQSPSGARAPQHSAAFRGNRLCAQQIRAVDKLTALRRVYDFIDLRQRLASMETALLAPEPRRGTSGFVLLDLGKAHLYRARCTVGHVGAGREDCKVKTPLVATAILGGCEHSQVGPVGNEGKPTQCGGFVRMRVRAQQHKDY